MKMISKEKLKKHIDSFPEEMNIEELIERILFLEKLEERIEQSEKGETITENELQQSMEEWFKSNG